MQTPKRAFPQNSLSSVEIQNLSKVSGISNGRSQPVDSLVHVPMLIEDCKV